MKYGIWHMVNDRGASAFRLQHYDRLRLRALLFGQDDQKNYSRV